MTDISRLETALGDFNGEVRLSALRELLGLRTNVGVETRVFYK